MLFKAARKHRTKGKNKEPEGTRNSLRLLNIFLCVTSKHTNLTAVLFQFIYLFLNYFL